MATATEAPAPAGGLVPRTPFQFTPAAKEARPLRALLDGPPGSGRLTAALRMAGALGDRIAVIDTERGRSRQYADAFSFDVAEMTTFDPKDLCLALYAAADYDVVIISSWSSFWSGPEGIRDQVAARSGKGSRDSGWDEVRPVERQMLAAVQCHPGHVIGVLRNRLDVVLATDLAGRTVPTRVSLRAEQRDGLEYDFDFAASMLPSHEMLATKSAAPGLTGEILTDAADTGARLLAWSQEGIDCGPTADLLHRAYARGASYEELSELAQEVQLRRAGAMAALDHKDKLTTLGDLVSFRLSRAYPKPPPPPPAAQGEA